MIKIYCRIVVGKIESELRYLPLLLEKIRKTFKQINKKLINRGFTTKGKNPVKGEGSYFHPETGRKYHLDKGGKAYKEGTELPHVDVHRRNIETGANVEKLDQLPLWSKFTEPKRKYPLAPSVRKVVA